MPEDKTALCGRITLNPGILPSNYYAGVVQAYISSMNLTAVAILQPLILLSNRFFSVDADEIGFVLAKLILLQTATKIILTPLYGILIDKLGRRPMFYVGTVVILIGYLLVPFQKTVFPGYALSKVLVSNGGNILFLLPFTADYVQDKTKGKATGIVQAVGSFGSFCCSLIVAILMEMGLNLVQIHLFFGIFIFVINMAISPFIKGGSYYLKNNNKSEDEDILDRKNQEESGFVKLMKAVKVLVRNGWLLISLIINTLARADYYLVTIIFALWMKSFAVTQAEQEETDKKINLYEALFFGLGLGGNLVYGVILDKVQPIKVIFPTILFGILGYFFIFMAPNKDSVEVLFFILAAGLAMPGLFNSAAYLAVKNYPKELRATLSSLINLFGVAGYLFLSTVGGILYDKVSKKMPFILFVIMLLMALLGVSIIYWKIKKNENKTRQPNTA
jgi:MFS family permease